MNGSMLFISMLLFFGVMPQQREKIILGEFCYFEQNNGLKNSGNAVPFLYKNYIELRFNSGYQMVIDSKKKRPLIVLLEKYKSNMVSDKMLLGKFKPESISGANEHYSVVDTRKPFQVFYNGNSIIFEIPELNDIFSKGTLPNHTIIVPEGCIDELIACLKKY